VTGDLLCSIKRVSLTGSRGGLEVSFLGLARGD